MLRAAKATIRFIGLLGATFFALTSFAPQLPGKLLKVCDVSRDDAQGANDTVVIGGSLFPDFEPPVATLDPVVLVMLAVVGSLGLVHLHPLNDRFRPRHRRPPSPQRRRVQGTVL